jgi:hypothetical protein
MQAETVNPASPQVSLPVRLVLGTCGALVAAALLWHFLLYLRHAVGAVFYPFELDYGEGIVWQQALLIPGTSMYGDITHYPFIVFHYPPFYHLVVRGLAAAGLDMLVAGRAVSLVSALAIGMIVTFLAFRTAPRSIGRTARLTGSAIAGLTVFCYEPVVAWSPLMRVDMLAVALGFLAVLCAVTSPGRPWRLYAGFALFLLAMFTKQTSIAAPMATFPVMLLIDRRRTLMAAFATLVVGLALLLLLEVSTGGGFLRHILLYNLNRYRFDLLIEGIVSQWHHTVFLLFTLGGVISLWRRLAGERSWANRHAFIRDVAESIDTRCLLAVTLYLIITTLMLVMLGKSGAADNYLIEGMCVWSVIIGAFVASLMDRAIVGVSTIVAPVSILLGWLLVGQMLIMPTSNGEYWVATPASTRALEALRSRIANLPGPVLSDDMVLLLRAGKDVPWEPAIFAELASQGSWDQRLIIDRIKAHAFAMIVTQGQPGELNYDSRHTPEVTRAIAAAYPRIETMAGRILHLPPL